MTRKYYKKWRAMRQRIKRTFKKRRKLWVPVTILALLLLAIGRILFMPDSVSIAQQSYKPLLNTIAQGESKGNYNAYYGNAGNSEVAFTSMTVAQVLDWQSQFVAQGSPSSAVGKYQIVRPTLQGLVQQMNLDTSAVFDETLQDKMAIILLERRGSLQYVDNKISRDQFAANISQEWAALPKTLGENPNQSYYEGDGLNSARISVDQVYDALSQLQKM